MFHLSHHKLNHVLKRENGRDKTKPHIFQLV